MIRSMDKEINSSILSIKLIKNIFSINKKGIK